MKPLFTQTVEEPLKQDNVSYLSCRIDLQTQLLENVSKTSSTKSKTAPVAFLRPGLDRSFEACQFSKLMITSLKHLLEPSKTR